MRFKTALLSVALFLGSCKNLSVGDEDSYGLTTVSLRLSSENYGRLNSQLFSKRPADANIRIRDGMDVDCRVSYAGRSSLDAYRKSFDLDFCTKEYRGRSVYRLSAQSIDKSMIRAVLGYAAFRKMGLDTPHAEPVSAYINREYLGLYLLMEVIDEEYFRVHGRAVRDIYKSKYGNAGFKAEFADRLGEAFTYEGKPDNFTFLAGVYEALWKTKSDEDFSREIEKILDLNSFMAYMATALYIAHWDGFDNNYYLVFDRTTNKLQTVPWDLDRIWEKTDTLPPEALVSRNELLIRLMKMDKYKALFAESLRRIQELYPLATILEDVAALQVQTAEAYKHDPVLSHVGTQEKVFAELTERITAWDALIRKYQETL